MQLVGLAELSLRSWSEGCVYSPMGYLEGWFVAAAEDWARSRACTDMAGDAELANRISEAGHL